MHPVGAGLVQSLARPGGNITGLTNNVRPEIEAKRLELLKALLPDVSRVAYLASKENVDWEAPWGKNVRAAAQALGVTLVLAEHTPHQPQDREGARPDDPAVAPAAGGSGHRVDARRLSMTSRWSSCVIATLCCLLAVAQSAADEGAWKLWTRAPGKLWMMGASSPWDSVSSFATKEECMAALHQQAVAVEKLGLKPSEDVVVGSFVATDPDREVRGQCLPGDEKPPETR
jgi:hypothetical protein